MKLKPLQCLENIIPDMEVYSFQNAGLQSVLLNKKMLLGFDTGTGKTFTYSLIVRALLNRHPEKKHLFIIIHDSIDQALKDVSSLVAAPVAVYSSVDGQLKKLSREWDATSVVIITYEVFQRDDIVLFLYRHLKDVESLVVDEAHHASNWDVSNGAFMLRALAHYVPFVVELSATPVTRDSMQFYRLMNLMDRNLSARRDETYMGLYDDRYMSVNRGDYDIKGKYTVTPEIVSPLPNQVGNIKGVIFKVLKGTGAYPQAEATVRLVKNRLRQGKRIIIYVHYHDSRQWLEKNLSEAGVSTVSLHGKITNRDERQEILRRFGDREVNVLLTSVSESLNIDADVVIFYEFTTKLKQVLGRAHRGLSAKELELVFVLTKNTVEIDYFLKYVYARSLTIQKLLGKDYSEFIQAGECIKEMRIASDDVN